MIDIKEILKLDEENLNKLFDSLESGSLHNKHTDMTEETKYGFNSIQNEILSGKKILEFKFVYDSISEKQLLLSFEKHPLVAMKNHLNWFSRTMKSYKPDFVTFSSSAENLNKIYNKFFELYGWYTPDYIISNKNPITGYGTGDNEFWLKRKE